ncbi:hypothetical protein [Mycolicibacterium fortuitum]|uniref:hypothetical protein n=1 Tax=Mycolicibacterium fortuitum TaxID=1766 RepID=UPI0007EB013F|nr:hypothetical protein [Mycolicibacterium fortuitum]NOQ62812.1 hypothetical protein [Mycolicibacterium fortuitum]OBB46993.1 hypothetical protein A5754_07000 [Mycolicibacterium fortuitum]
MAKKRDEVLLDELEDRERDESALEREPLSAGEALADARAQASDETRDMLPEPKPGDPDYDWSGHYDTTDLYTHRFPDGTVVAIKPFASIYSKTWLYKIRQLQTDTDIEFAAIDRAACPTAQEVLMGLDDTNGDPFDDLYKAWLEAGTTNGDGDKGLTAGE